MDAGSLSDVRENQDFKLVNTPSSSNEVHFTNQDNYLEMNTCSKLESINKFQNMAKTMTSKSENLSQIAQDGYGKAPQYVDRCLSDESSSQYFLTTLVDIITSCTDSMNALENYIKYYLPDSTKTLTNTKQADTENYYDVDDYGSIQVPIRDVVLALVETLPSVFADDFQLGKELKILARKVSHAEISCDVCVCELKTAWIIIQKMFLFLSLGGNKLEIKCSIDELVGCLLRTNFACESESDICSLNDNSFLSESISSLYLLPFVDDNCSVRSNCDEPKSREDLKSLESELDSKENAANIQRINMNCQRQYLKLTHIESPCTSDEFCDENEAFKTEINGKHIRESDCIPLDFISHENACSSPSVQSEKCNGSNEVSNDQLFEHSPGKFWSSLDSFLRSKTSAKQQPGVQIKLTSNSSKSRVEESKEKSQYIQHTSNNPAANDCPPNSNLGVDEGNSYPTSRTTTSSFTTNPSNSEHTKDISKKIRTDTVQVKMTNKGEGFGLILGVKYNSRTPSVVIHSIKPKSPAQKSGVLKVDDRIIAINHKSTLGLTPNTLQALSQQSLSAEAIILKVEFHVMDVRPKFGTFDVILDKMLKIGLVFEDMKRGFPMSVSGIVKGSGAHRCGQLFPGDKIKFFRCIRCEEFDPVSCNYSKEESVLITVQREPESGHQAKSGTEPTCYFNPCFSHVDSVPQRGKSSLVKNRTVHAVGGSEALVLDLEVTLFRDPVYWDFGFLVGENADTGRAYVTDVRPEGPAADSGAVKKFDRIVQVNGILVDKNIENSVLALLSQANHKVDLLIRRLYREDSKTI